MQIRIDNSSPRAVYQQIVDAVKREIALGKMRQGEKLATVRQLSMDLIINPNTIAKAYKQLEAEGIIVTRPGSGAFVAELSTNLDKKFRKKIIGEEFERIVVESIHMKITGEELEKWFFEAKNKFKNAFGEQL